MKSIIFWGAPPPPIGGMTVHIERLSHYLSKNGWVITHFNFTSFKHNRNSVKKINNLIFWYTSLFFLNRKNIHYVITTRPKIRFLASILVLTGQKVILREGGRDLQKTSKSSIILKVINIVALKMCSAFIGVNKDICDFAKKYKSSKKIFKVNGFIYPPEINYKTPNDIVSFFGSSKLSFVTSGQVFEKTEDDIHGLWSMIPFIKAALIKNIDIKLCIVSYNYGIDNTNVRNEYINEISRQGVSNNIFFFHSNIQLWPILKYSNYFIRASITDGDSNAVREALALNNIVFSTDCVKRPKNCILYRTGDPNDLVEKVSTTLNKNIKPKNLKVSAKNEELIESILNNLN